jgi:hypothetical protein
VAPYVLRMGREVRDGSFPDVAARSRNVRSSLNSGHCHATSACPFCAAMNGHRNILAVLGQLSGHSVCWNANANYVPPRNISIRHS